MARHGVKPDLVLCSTAARTRATLACIQPMLGLPDTSVEFEDELYLASHTTMLRLIKAIPGGPLHVMIVGHNPGMQSLALALTNRDGEAPLGEGLLQSIARKFPTCGLAVFQFDAPAWSVIATGTGKLIHFMAPRLLE